MKKRVLLSVAAATALTFGLGTNGAKAETVQPSPIKVQNISQSPFFMQHMNQQDFQSFLTSLLNSYAKWNPGAFQPGNCVIPGQPTNVTITTPWGDVVITNPINNNETNTPADKPADNNQANKPADKPAEKPAEKPVEKPVEKPAEKPAEKPVDKPADNNQATKPADKPADNNQANKPADKPAEDSKGSLSAFEQKVVDLTNAERAKQGLPALKVDTELSKVARIKSEDMQKNHYFDHTSPTYGSPFDMMKQFGISYRSAGENIAQGQQTPEEVVQAWMNSAGHRANILNSGYTHIGVGYVENGNYWTQEFISK
ncbi:CAP domain-containing protein [Bacillus sp. 3103sda1]|uniref:CAP domain-containing protein n=1 Tax=Bacillus sp. 3103sda1 TaxID=2953808 RepID=UPI0020A07C10|nr:CAP domain-containing protein [Bacillus sp. 3103sda1]MCP1122965.1 CAP domain-containing protein [Bacillus sp. 3103sda1]